MSRYQQKTYQKVLKEPRRRYLLKKKEKRLWKSYSLKTQLKAWSFLLLYITIFIVLLFTLKPNNTLTITIVLAWAIGGPFIALLFSEDKREKEKKRKIPISLSEFIAKSNELVGISNVYIRAIRHVLGYIYDLNPCQIHPTDSPENLAYLTRTGRPPFAFELVLGAAHRLSIPLNDSDIDQITENIYNCPDVETLIVKLSRELEKRRGNNCQGAIDITHSLPEERMKVWKCVLWGCLLFGFLSLQIFLEEHDFTQASIVSRIFILTAIGGLLGWGYAALGNWQPKKNFTASERLLKQLISLSNNVVGKYLYFLLASISPGEIVTIKESESFPECKEGEFERVPLFSEICAFLKTAIEVEDRFYEQSIEGELVFCVKDRESQEEKFHITATICDGIEDAYVTFQRTDSDGKLGEGNC